MTTLGPYTLLRRLGAGGMGEVWIARRDALGGAAKLVAIKTLLPEKASDPTARQLFLEEARLSMLMTNSNIVQVFDAEQTRDGTCYMAMEFVEGIDLAQLTAQLHARGEKLSHSAIAYIVGELLKALVYAHDLNVDGTRRTIVHRDISPQNVMLSVSGEVKLMDFGIARLASEDTSGLFIKGKLRYMPPEQLDGESRAPTIDLFAVGAILHELLDGKRFRGGAADETRLIGMCVKGEVPPLTGPPDAVPAEFERLRKGLLEPVVADRIPNAREAHRQLSQWPGDRDAKFELEDIVRRVTSSTASSTVLEPKTEILDIAESGVDPTELLPNERGNTDAERQREARARADEESTDARNSQRSVTALEARAPASRVPGNHSRLIMVFGGIGLVFAATGVSMTLGMWADDNGPESPNTMLEQPTLEQVERLPEHDEPEPKPVVEQSEPVAEPPEPVAEHPELLAEQLEPIPEQSELEPGPNPAGLNPAAEQPHPEPEPEPLELGSKSPSKPQPAQVPKTSVTITATGVWAQVKLAGKTYTFDRLKGVQKASTRLKPGHYPVSFRNDPDDAWQPAGKASIPEGGPVTLNITAGKATVEK